MDWKKTLGALAPTIAHMAGGPLAGMAATVITKALGIAPDEVLDLDDDIQMQAAMGKLTTEQVIALKQQEAQTIKDLEQMKVDIYAIDAEDRQDARLRERAVGSGAVNVLAFIIIGALIAVVGYIIVNGMPTDANGNPVDNALIGTLIGYVASAALMVVSYFFGSSAGSQQKTEKLAEKFGKLN